MSFPLSKKPLCGCDGGFCLLQCFLSTRAEQHAKTDTTPGLNCNGSGSHLSADSSMIYTRAGGLPAVCGGRGPALGAAGGGCRGQVVGATPGRAGLHGSQGRRAARAGGVHPPGLHTLRPSHQGGQISLMLCLTMSLLKLYVFPFWLVLMSTGLRVLRNVIWSHVAPWGCGDAWNTNVKGSAYSGAACCSH